jgi:DNA-binding YbaB/EbfC family protein
LDEDITVTNQKQLNQMMRQVQKMQADMVAAQEALADETVEASAGGGMVTAVVSGTGDLKKVAISPDVVDPDDVEMLEDLVVAAVVEATRLAQELAQERMGGLTAGLDMGGLGGLLGS